MNDTALNPTPVSDALHETAARGVEAIHAIVIERDQLRKKTDTLEVNIALLQQDLDNTRKLLTVCQAERDHYMRHSVEIVAHLNDIQIVINEAIKAAGLVNFRPPTVPGYRSKLEAVSAEDSAKLESLIAKLPASNGGGK